MRHRPGCVVGNRTLRLGKMEVCRSLSQREVGQAVNSGRSPEWTERGAGGPQLSLRAQRGKDSGDWKTKLIQPGGVGENEGGSLGMLMIIL